MCGLRKCGAATTWRRTNSRGSANMCGPLVRAAGFVRLRAGEAGAGAYGEQAGAPRAQIKEILVEESNVQPVNSPVTVRALPLPENARLHAETLFMQSACTAQSLLGALLFFTTTLDAAVDTLDMELNVYRGLGYSAHLHAAPQEGHASHKRPACRAARRCAATSTGSSTTS